MLAASELGTENMPSWFFLRDPYYFEDVPQNERAVLASENLESSKRVNSFLFLLLFHLYYCFNVNFNY